MNSREQGRLSSDQCTNDWIYDRESECATQEQVKSLADERWELQASRLLDRSGFYARKYQQSGVDFAKVRSVADLPYLPFTTKSEIKDAQLAHPPFGDHLGVPLERVKRVYQTSGTTGEPSLLALTAHDLETVWGSIALRSYYGSGFHPHNSVLTNFAAGPFVAGTTHRILERIGTRSVPVPPADTDRITRSLELGLIDSLLGTPSFMLYLVSLFEARKIDARGFGIVHISVGGEPGAGIPAIRSRIEEAFDTELTEVMGLGDIAASLFGECPVRGGMHFCGQGYVWMELIDPSSGDAVEIKPGAQGEPVYTHLDREAMPLIRFKSGDFVEIQDDGCGCGRTSFRIRCIGRVDDMFIVRGVNVYPSAIQAVVAEYRPRVTGRVRVVLPDNAVSVEPPVRVDVEMPNDGAMDTSLAADLTAAIRAKLTFRAAITLVPEKEFGDAGYKTRSVVRGATQRQ